VDIINDTPFAFGYIAGRMPFPGHSLTLIVKGTFDLVHNGNVIPSDDQQLPTGDEFYEDDEDMQGGPHYASDFSYYKPLADLSLVGHGHAPKDTMVPARRIAFQVGDVVRSLTVYGDRHWIGPVATDPELFYKIPIRYNYSFGGKGFNKNPTGRGYAKAAGGDGDSRRYLPNIMQSGEEMATPFSKLEPAGFGPLHREWPQRRNRLGSYNKKYLKTRWPWFAEDMDWRYFNTAPEGLQTGFLRGDEDLYFENLHPDHQDYRSKLAGIRTRCFVNRGNGWESSGEEAFSEVPMHLDTLWVDMDNEKVVLVWRGWTQVVDEEFEEIEHILIAAEPLDKQPESISHYDALLARRLQEEEDLWEEEPPPQEPEPEIEDDSDKLIAEAEASYRQAMTDAGMDPDNPPEPGEEEKRSEEQILKELGLGELDESDELTREAVAVQFEKTRDISELDLSEMDLSDLDFSGGNLQAAVLKGANLSGTKFDAADLTGALLADATLTGASLKKANLTDTDFSAADCARINLNGATIVDAIFDGARLADAEIERAKAAGASFIEADLSGANFSGSDLSGADLSASNITEADFRDTNLSESTLEEAQGPGVVMDGADLTELRASGKPNFAGGSFKNVTGKESIWEGADLSATDFSFSKMVGASFEKANLKSARMRAADMKHARFSKADLSNADLVFANLFESSFEKARLAQSDFRNANLYGAEFLDATLEQTRFESANLKMTKLAES
jgi:uncharacterized protein YjbI with pentapeptide repeats